MQPEQASHRRKASTMNVRVRNACWMSAVLVAVLIRATAVAGELGTRIALNAMRADVTWQTNDNASVERVESAVLLTKTGGKGAWASPGARMPLLPETEIRVHVDSLNGKSLRVQAEWLNDEGQFIEATRLADLDEMTPLDRRIPLNGHVPADIEPASFNLKLWLIGEKTEVRLKRLAVEQPRTWPRTNTRTLAQLVPPKVKVDAGEGVTADVMPKAVRFALSADQEAAGSIIRGRYAYDANLTVMLDLAALQGGRVTLTLICFDGNGEYLNGVPLMKALREPELHHADVSDVKGDMPAATRRVGFKLWLIGETPEAEMAGLFVGRRKANQ